MNSFRHVTFSLILSLLCFASGVIGYCVIEKWDLIDSIYMTIITLTTVGFSEVHELSRAGRVFTILFVFFGAGLTMYVIIAVMEFIIEGQIRSILGRKRLDRRIKRLKNHYIICGYGRIGSVLCKHLGKKPLDFVVIDSNQDLISTMDEDRIMYLSGDATAEDTLITAGVKRAKGLISVLSTDTDNVFLVLTARQLNPNLDIVAKACHDESKSKLKAAGANRVESPYETGAKKLAQRILRPTVTNILDPAFTDQNNEMLIEEITVGPLLAGVMLKDSGIREKFNLIIIAIKKAKGTMMFNPAFNAKIDEGDILIAVGEEKSLRAFEKAFNPNNR